MLLASCAEQGFVRTAFSSFSDTIRGLRTGNACHLKPGYVAVSNGNSPLYTLFPNSLLYEAGRSFNGPQGKRMATDSWKEYRKVAREEFSARDYDNQTVRLAKDMHLARR